MKRSFGRSSQRIELGRVIRITAATPSSTITGQSFPAAFPSSRFFEVLLARSAAIAVSTINTMATLEATQLKALWSGSSMVVYRKFCAGSSPEERAWPILTQRCSYTAGTK
jgi:hypothetical protein